MSYFAVLREAGDAGSDGGIAGQSAIAETKAPPEPTAMLDPYELIVQAVPHSGRDRNRNRAMSHGERKIATSGHAGAYFGVPEPLRDGRDRSRIVCGDRPEKVLPSSGRADHEEADGVRPRVGKRMWGVSGNVSGRAGCEFRDLISDSHFEFSVEDEKRLIESRMHV
jgi:hypothetical protein